MRFNLSISLRRLFAGTADGAARTARSASAAAAASSYYEAEAEQEYDEKEQGLDHMFQRTSVLFCYRILSLFFDSRIEHHRFCLLSV